VYSLGIEEPNGTIPACNPKYGAGTESFGSNFGSKPWISGCCFNCKHETVPETTSAYIDWREKQYKLNINI